MIPKVDMPPIRSKSLSTPKRWWLARAASTLGCYSALMWFQRKKDGATPPALQSLRQTVALHLPEADEDLQAIVVAVAGLLACVAFEDRILSDAEYARIKSELARVQGLSAAGVEAVAGVLREHAEALFSSGDQFFARELKERCVREQRVEVLEILVDLAAVDDVLTVTETNNLRRLTTAMGLTQQ
ncbi:MAG: TerB family tellurite resistance protein, partial [Myxococcota bacterium]